MPEVSDWNRLGAALLICGFAGACGGDTNTGPGPAPQCGDGTVDAGEDCDGAVSATCTSLNPFFVGGSLTCVDCQYDSSGCEASPDDPDGDGVASAFDPLPNDYRICGDSDADGCDDCSVQGLQDPAEDGYDIDGDGMCELPLDYECMNGTYAPSDPDRLEACVMFTLVNRDRAEFSTESGGGAPLEWNEQIWEVAHAHSVDMCTREFFAHMNPDGQEAGERSTAAGYPGLINAENIAANLDPAAAEYGFMNEPTCTGHRGNILDAGSLEVGIGYFKCERIPSSPGYMWGDHHHVTQNFRAPGPASSFCSDPATSCEVPPNPPSVAVCPAQLVSWGFCPEPTAAMLPEWGCPAD